MSTVIKFLVIYFAFFAFHTYVLAADNFQDMAQTEKNDSQTPGLCYKPQKKCDYRQLSSAEIDTATAMADEVAFQLKNLDELEKKAGRDFKVALIARAGTDLGKFKVLKDVSPEGKSLKLADLVTRLKNESGWSPELRNSGANPLEINPQVLNAWIDKKRTMEFSHISIALKNHKKSDHNYHWQVMHLLWTCAKDVERGAEAGDRSYIWEEGMGAVFADDMKQYRAQIMIPKTQIQDRIEDLLIKNKVGSQWHNKKYNAAALANDLDQQNSNQWVLEVLAATLRPNGQVKDRAGAQKVLAETGFMETKVKPSGLYSLINVPFAKNFLPGTVCMNRQPLFKEGFGEIISVLSIEEYLRRNQLLVRDPVVVQLPDEMNFVKQEKGQKKNP